MPLEILAIFLIVVIALLIALWLQGQRHGVAIERLRDEFSDELGKASLRLFGQIEADTSLRDRLGLRQGLPYSHGWSAAPDFLKLIVEHTLATKPALIVECSSGLTTLMLARCCAMNGHGHVHSLENGPEFAARTRAELARYGLEAYATVIDAPLMEYSLTGHAYQWYDTTQLPEGGIDMLVIDGPPGFIQRHSRFPALPLLHERLAPGGAVFLDDAARPDERQVFERWCLTHPDLKHEYLTLERGCGILRRDAHAMPATTE